MITDIEPDFPFDYENKKSDVFRAHIFSDLVFSSINVLETISIIAFSLYQNENVNLYVHLPSTNRIFQISKHDLCPLNSLFLSIFKYYFNFSDQVIIALISTLYSFLVMYLFRNMLYSLKLGRFANALSCVLLIYPLHLHIQSVYIAREVLLLILVMYSIILYQQNKFWQLCVVVFLSSLTTEGGILLYFAFFIAYLVEKRSLNAALLSFLFIISFYLGNTIGFFSMLYTGLFAKFAEFSHNIASKREAESILQMILIPLLGCFNIYSISYAPAFITSFFIIQSMFRTNSSEVSSAIIPQVLSLIGYSYLMTPRVKIGVFIASFIFLYPLIDAASVYIRENIESNSAFD